MQKYWGKQNFSLREFPPKWVKSRRRKRRRKKERKTMFLLLLLCENMERKKNHLREYPRSGSKAIDIKERERERKKERKLVITMVSIYAWTNNERWTIMVFIFFAKKSWFFRLFTTSVRSRPPGPPAVPGVLIFVLHQLHQS